MLRELDFETTEAENGQEALDRLQQFGKLDLFMVNWNMPIVDGLQFIHAVRADPRHANVPLVVVSGESDPQTIDRAIKAGANDFLVKPVAQQSLDKALSQLGFSDRRVAKGERTSSPSDKPTSATAPRTVASKPPQPVARSAPIRVLVVDDSVVVRGIVSKVLEDDPDLEVAATAADGRMALNKLAKAAPDVILLDIEMPNMNGFEMLKELRKANSRVPVIMFSSLTDHGAAATVDALLLGAKDYVPKPGGAQMSDSKAGKQAIREELIPKIKQFAPRLATTRDKPRRVSIPPLPKARQSQRVEIVAIGVSTGGPQALAQILPRFARECPVPIVIVQHMPPVFTKHLAERLTSECGLPVDEAAAGQSVQPGRVLLAPGGFHMLMTQIGERVKVRLTQDPPVNACRPSVDVLFQSVTNAYGAGSLAVVLTGMGDDGAKGCESIYNAGGRVLVQDEPSSVVWGMPGSVVRAGVADKVLALRAIAAEISRQVSEKRTKTSMS